MVATRIDAMLAHLCDAVFQTAIENVDVKVASPGI